MAIQVGDTVGDYRVEGVLGKGGMGKVFRVRSLLTGRLEAMKVVLPDLAENAELADRFLREIRVHASLDHPNIAALYTALRADNRVLMIMELVDGVSVEELLRQGPLEWGRAVELVCEVLDALEYAHGHGVIHRDIKPANMLVTREGRLKLTDFGIARSAGDRRLTHTGFALGSLPYMSPEQVRSDEADARSDIYSLGIALYEMLTGRRPIEGENEYALMNAQLHQMPAAPSEVFPAIPRGLSDAVMKALAKDPADRFQTAAEFRAALRAIRGETPAGGAAIAPRPPLMPAEEISLMETRLSRFLGPIAKRLVADAAQRSGTPAELCARLAEQIADGSDRQAFLRSCGTATTATMTAAAGRSASESGLKWDPALLVDLAEGLAAFVGPIARVVVNRAAKKARSEDELYAAVAEEIPGEADRKRFLAIRSRRQG